MKTNKIFKLFEVFSFTKVIILFQRDMEILENIIIIDMHECCKFLLLYRKFGRFLRALNFSFSNTIFIYRVCPD